jgi:hypothetical protein
MTLAPVEDNLLAGDLEDGLERSEADLERHAVRRRKAGAAWFVSLRIGHDNVALAHPRPRRNGARVQRRFGRGLDIARSREPAHVLARGATVQLAGRSEPDEGPFK